MGLVNGDGDYEGNYCADNESGDACEDCANCADYAECMDYAVCTDYADCVVGANCAKAVDTKVPFSCRNGSNTDTVRVERMCSENVLWRVQGPHRLRVWPKSKRLRTSC